MRNAEQYSYITTSPDRGEIGFRPCLPIQLINLTQTVPGLGLLDTGATINVMPYAIGQSLGYVWENQTTPLNLTGNLARTGARLVFADVKVGEFPPVQLVFAWAETNSVPLILGQVNFFMEFDICFYRAQRYFKLCPKTVSP